jgi:hypothetical protein
VCCSQETDGDEFLHGCYTGSAAVSIFRGLPAHRLCSPVMGWGEHVKVQFLSHMLLSWGALPKQGHVARVEGLPLSGQSGGPAT